MTEVFSIVSLGPPVVKTLMVVKPNKIRQIIFVIKKKATDKLKIIQFILKILLSFISSCN